MPKNHDRNTSPLVEARKKVSEEKLATLKTTLEDMVSNHEPISIPRVCELTGLSKSFLYKNDTAHAMFKEAKSASQLYDHSFKPEIGHAQTGLTFKKNDLLLQYAEVKRKLQESYILEHQLLSAENDRLRKEIAEIEEKIHKLQGDVAHKKESPLFRLSFIPSDIPSDELITYQVCIKDKIYNPVGKKAIKNVRWGKVTISSPKFRFELEKPIDGVSIEKIEDDYILTISEDVSEAMTIRVLILRSEM